MAITCLLVPRARAAGAPRPPGPRRPDCTGSPAPGANGSGHRGRYRLYRESAVSFPWEVQSSMSRLPGTVALGALLASLIFGASDARASPSHQDDDDPQLMGVA